MICSKFPIINLCMRNCVYNLYNLIIYMHVPIYGIISIFCYVKYCLCRIIQYQRCTPSIALWLVILLYGWLLLIWNMFCVVFVCSVWVLNGIAGTWNGQCVVSVGFHKTCHLICSMLWVTSLFSAFPTWYTCTVVLKP